jgi:hypothetical protein
MQVRLIRYSSVTEQIGSNANASHLYREVTDYPKWRFVIFLRLSSGTPGYFPKLRHITINMLFSPSGLC